MSNFCTSCGAEVSESNKFCTRCGSPIQRTTAEAVPVSGSYVPAASGSASSDYISIDNMPSGSVLSGSVSSSSELSGSISTDNVLSGSAPFGSVSPGYAPSDLYVSGPVVSDSEASIQTTGATISTAQTAPPVSTAQTARPTSTIQKTPPVSTVQTASSPPAARQPAPVADADSIPTKTSKYQPISTRGYIGIWLLMMIPGINLLLLIVWACGGCRKINKRNYARAMLVMAVVFLVLGAILAFVFRNALNGLIPLASPYGSY